MPDPDDSSRLGREVVGGLLSPRRLRLREQPRSKLDHLAGTFLECAPDREPVVHADVAKFRAFSKCPEEPDSDFLVARTVEQGS